MKLLSAAVALVVLLSALRATADAQTQPVRVLVNDVQIALPTPAEFQQGTLVAAVAPVVQAFGATAAWDPASGTLAVTGANGTAVRLVAGQPTATVGGETWTLSVPPTLRDGVMVGPVGAILQQLGAYVVEDPTAGTLEAVSQVTEVTWRAEAGAVVVSVTATGPVRAQDYVFHSPERVVVDLSSAVIRLAQPDRTIGVGPVVGMRAAQFQVHPYITRLVFDLAHPLGERVTASSGVVTVVLGGAGVQAGPPPGAAPRPTPQTPLRNAPPPGPPPASAPAPQPAVPPPGDSQQPSAGAVFVSTQAAAAKSSGAAQPASGTAPGSASAASPEPLALPPLPPFEDRPGAFHVYGVTYDAASGQLVIHASQPFTYAVAQWRYPDRLAIDISGGVFLDRRKDLEVGVPSIRNIVISQLNLSPNVTRILVHLAQQIPYVTASSDRGRTLAVTFLDGGARSQPASASAAPGARAPVVVIDPGHGGDDPGAIGAGGLREADVTLAIGKMVRDALQRQGMRVTLTRTDDSSVALEDRPDLAQRAGASMFVSIHANASTNRGAQGSTTYYYSPQSQPLAAAIQQEVVRALGEPDRGIQTARFYVIVNATMPAVLIETAFITNAKEEAMLRDPAVQRRIADAIARGIEAYLGAQAEAAPP